MSIRTLAAIAFILTLSAFGGAARAASDLRGSWQAESYTMKDGTITYPARGQIIFADKDWTVLFFTIKDGLVVRGSGEGGFYETSGDKLVFFHRFFAGPAFEAIPGLKAQKGDARINETPIREETTYKIEGDRLTISFGPSGNKLTWTRSSE
jgi:hypothetical protein